MKAAVYARYGPPDVLSIAEVPKPEPKDDEVLIRMVASTVSAPDWRVRKAEPAMVRLIMGVFKPKQPVLGYEFAGDVEAVGKAVTRFKPGDAVFGMNLDRKTILFGAYAEYLCIPETRLIVHKPATLDYGQAAAVPSGTMTAYTCIQTADLKPGEKVLINGASGSIGTNAVQLAKARGAEVTAVCNRNKIDFVKALGADHVIDYTQEDFTQSPQRYDFILDAVGFSSFVKCRHLLTPTGRYLSTGLGSFFQNLMYGLLTRKSKGKRVLFFAGKPSVEELEIYKELIVAGQLRPIIDRRFPLEQVAEAHRYVELGHKKGNVVIQIREERRS